MILSGIEKIPPYERMHIMVLSNDVDNSQHLNETQKRVIERKIQEIIDVWNNKDYL